MADCLVEYLAQRTPERFRALVDAMRHHVGVVARRWVGDATLAEEVTHQVFLRVARSRWEPGQIVSGRAFLASVAVSVARTLLRQRQRLARREILMAELPERPVDTAGPVE